MLNLSRVWALALFFCSFGLQASAAAPLDVVINEIAWMGSKNSSADEWLELYNGTNSQINLTGWKLTSQDGSIKINLAGIIGADGFYLLERTDDDSVPGITADQIYKGTLSNKGENLQLYDNQGNLMDSVNCASGWFGGDNQTKQTMERKNFLLAGNDASNWQTSQDPAGTPKAQNSKGVILDTKVSASNEGRLAEKSGPVPSEEDKTITDLKNKGAAAIGKFSENTGGKKDVFPLPALFVALTISLFSGILILLIKKNIKTNV
jgi:hypothetical protein